MSDNALALQELAESSHRDTLLIDELEASEPGNSARLVKIAAGKIHWVDEWRCWIVYNGGKWVVDNSNVRVTELARGIPQYLFTLAENMFPGQEIWNEYQACLIEDKILKGKDRGFDKSATNSKYDRCRSYEFHLKWAKESNTNARIFKLIDLAKSFKGIWISYEELDNKPMLFNVENGTFNLSTMTLQDFDPGDLLTFMAPVKYNPQAKGETWNRVIRQWLPREEVRAYLQRATGSGLTGISLESLFLNVGDGSNGKSQFYNGIMRTLGGYAVVPSDALFIETKNGAHSEELVKLRGARMLICSETTQGGRLDENLVKRLTGNDTLSARRLYGSVFEFLPSHTAFIHTNYAPAIKGTDVGIWRRLIKILWEMTVKKGERDPLLKSKLDSVDERSAILNWLIEGCADWMAHGLNEPEIIEKWSEEYRISQDHLGLFLSDVYGGGFQYETASNLRKKYEAWCDANGHGHPWSARAIGAELTHKGYESVRDRRTGELVRGWINTKTENIRHNEIASDQDLSNSNDALTLSSYTTRIEKVYKPLRVVSMQDIEEGNREGTSKPSQTFREPTPEEWEEINNQWKIDAGYISAPREPTQSELDALAQAELEDWHERNKPADWV